MQELGSTSERGGGGRGHGYGERRSQVRSVTRGRESRGGGGGPERERRSRGSRASPWRREEVGEAATTKQEVEASACARACVLLRLCLLAEVEDSRSAPVGWTGAAGPATGKWPRYGSFSLSLFLIISVFYYSVNLGLY